MKDLFQGNLNIIHINNKEDVDLNHQALIDLRNLVLQCNDMYPDIDKWFDEKVIPGIENSKRIGLIGYNNNEPLVSAIVKKSNDAKFCHLKVHQGLRDLNIGNIFFSLMALEVRENAKSIHFTLPESLWKVKESFFKSFGFTLMGKANIQYRENDPELICKANTTNVWQNVIRKIPDVAKFISINGCSLEKGLLLSIKPIYANKILRKEKKIEIRRSFSKKWINSKVNFYSSSPFQALVGEGLIYNIIKDHPDKIWKNHSKEIACQPEEYFQYVSGKDEVYALFLDDIYEYISPITLTQVKHLIGKELHPPQSHCSLANNEDWFEGVSMASLLHGKVHISGNKY